MNVLEASSVNLEVAHLLVQACASYGVPLIFKASFDKANRSDHRSYRGPGLKAGLAQLAQIKAEFSVPIVTDVHETSQVEPVAQIADLIQIPAFLSRQTDLLQASARTGRPILLKKMQMMSPSCALQARDKLMALGSSEVIICERGTSFGYQNLVLDLQGVCEMKRADVPIVVDVTHALQQPGRIERQLAVEDAIYLQWRAAVALGIGGIFFECHPNPKDALCDGPCALPLGDATS